MAKWGEKRISAIPLTKFWEKVGERREKWCGREKKEFQQWYWQKKKKMNCDNWIAEIGGLKKGKKEDWTMTKVMLRPHTILPYFLQIVVMANFLLILIRAHQ